MAATSSIEWTDATWNPITGCTLVSEGCRNCYAARVAATRLKNHPSRKGLARINAGVPKFTGEVRFNEKWLDDPLRWKSPRRIFVCAHGDLFHEAVPDDWIDRIFARMARASHHTFQVLTKRPERARAYLSGNWQGRLIPHLEAMRPAGDTDGAQLETRNGVLANVWLGVSVEDQATADARIPLLLATPAAKRFLSAEPLLGPMDLMNVGGGTAHSARLALNALTGEHWRPGNYAFGVGPETPRIDWVIAGGESGPGARPSHPDWFRSLRDQCAAAEIPFLFKQWGAFREYDNGTPDLTVIDADEAEAEYHAETAQNPVWVSIDGHCVRDMDEIPASARYRMLEHVGKTAAGRLLDGVTHDGIPS